VAKAGGDQSVALPVKLVSIDGSQSSDDKGIICYTWTRDAKSLAAGVLHLYANLHLLKKLNR